MRSGLSFSKVSMHFVLRLTFSYYSVLSNRIAVSRTRGAAVGRPDGRIGARSGVGRHLFDGRVLIFVDNLSTRDIQMRSFVLSCDCLFCGIVQLVYSSSFFGSRSYLLLTRAMSMPGDAFSVLSGISNTV